MKSNEIEETRGTIGPIAIRALAVGAQSIGAIAVGAVALSAVAIGFIAIGRLVIGHAKIKRLEIGELRVTRLHVTDSIVTPPAAVTQTILSASSQREAISRSPPRSARKPPLLEPRRQDFACVTDQ